MLTPFTQRVVSPPPLSGGIFVDDINGERKTRALDLCARIQSAGLYCLQIPDESWTDLDEGWTDRTRNENPLFREAWDDYRNPIPGREYHWAIFGGLLSQCLRKEVEKIMKIIRKSKDGVTVWMTLPLDAIEGWRWDSSETKYDLPRVLANCGRQRSGVGGFVDPWMREWVNFFVDKYASVRKVVCYGGIEVARFNPSAKRTGVLNIVNYSDSVRVSK